MRIFAGPLLSARDAYVPVLSVVAVLSLVVGNFAAITQSNVKRLLAYSSISHAGYILFGLIAGSAMGIRGMVIYLGVYAFMTLGFFVAASLEREREVAVTVISVRILSAYAGSGGTAVLERTETGAHRYLHRARARRRRR